MREEDEDQDIDRMIWRLEDAITKLNLEEAKETQKKEAILDEEITRKFASNNASYNGQSRTFNTSPLVWDDGLALSAAGHCLDQGILGQNLQYGSDGSTILERIKAYGDNVGPNYAQGLSWGVETPRDGGVEKHAFMIMVKILAEAGYSKNKTNGDFARNIWSQKLNKVGVFTCMNMNWGRMTVLDYADSFVQNTKSLSTLKKWTVAKGRCPLKRAAHAKTLTTRVNANQGKQANNSYTSNFNGSTKLLNGFEKDFYLFTNRIRSNPDSIIPLVKAQMKNIDGMVMNDGTVPVMLWEGKSAWEDAIKRL